MEEEIKERADNIKNEKPEFYESLTEALREGLQNKVADVNMLNPRPMQVIVNDILLNQEKDVLHIVATSQGKTETFLIGCKEWRKKPRAGPVIVFSPLNSLIRDQLKRINEFGLRAYVMGSQEVFGKGHQAQTVKALNENRVDVLLITPNMITYANKNFHRLNEVVQLKANYKPQKLDTWEFVPLLVIDEIHMIASASDTFMASWKSVWNVIKDRPWFMNARKLGLSATLSSSDRSVLATYLPINSWDVVCGPRYRNAISIHVIPGFHSADTRSSFICNYIRTYPNESVLIFVQMKCDCSFYFEAINNLTNDERENGVVGFYHADLSPLDREETERKFLKGEIRYLVATKAIGLGFDKPDINAVIHTYTPPSVSQWYQEFGRAARDGNSAKAILLPSRPWGVDMDIVYLLPLYRHVKSVKRLAYSDAEKFLENRNVKQERIEEIILRGVADDLFETTKENEIEVIDTYESQSRLKAMTIAAQSDKTQLIYLTELCKMQEKCLWRGVLEHLQDQVEEEWKCGKCSAQSCLGDYDEIRFNSYAGSNKVYKATTPANNTVICLHKPGESIDFDPDRLQRIAAKFFIHYDTVPSQWIVTCIPDKGSKVSKRAKEFAESLNIDFVELIQLHPALKDHSMRNAKTARDRQEVLKKYSVTNESISGRLILFDDVLNTGTTMDGVIEKLTINAQVNLPIMGLVERVYPTCHPKEENIDDTESLTIFKK